MERIADIQQHLAHVALYYVFKDLQRILITSPHFQVPLRRTQKVPAGHYLVRDAQAFQGACIFL